MVALAFVLALVAGEPGRAVAQTSKAAPVLPSPRAQPNTQVPFKLPSPRLRARKVDPVATQRERAARKLRLRPFGRGYAYRGTPGDRFDAKIRADGTVVFDVDPRVRLKPVGLCLVAICKQRKAEPTAQRGRRVGKAALAVASALAEAAGGTLAGSRTFGQPVAGPNPGGERVHNPAFLLGAVQGRFGHLPMPVAAMRKFMTRTFELRVQLAQESALRDLEFGRKQVPQTLTRLWANPVLTRAQRNAELLSLWTDVDLEPQPKDLAFADAVGSTLDRQRRVTAARARAQILKSVLRHAPTGSPKAFTATELRTFNARPDTRVPFEPYRAPSSKPAGPATVLAPSTAQAEQPKQDKTAPRGKSPPRADAAKPSL